MSEDIILLPQDKCIRIEKYIKKTMKNVKIPGLHISIVKNNKIIYQKGFGYADIKQKTPVTNKTLFELASTSKAFTGLAIIRLEKNKLINLKDDVRKYIPWLKLKYEGQDAIVTLKHLLYHSSGIPFNTIDKIPISDDDNALEETVKTLVGIELNSRPGRRFQYATINYDVLALVIEKVSGMSYEKYMNCYILKPAKLNNTYLFRNKNVNKNMATGYKYGFFTLLKYNAPIYRGNKAAGYIISNGNDMSKWLMIQMDNLNTCKINKELIKRSHVHDTLVAFNTSGHHYASGWEVCYLKDKVIKHEGNNPNYSSAIAFKPYKNEGVAILCNRNYMHMDKISEDILNILDDRNYYNILRKGSNIILDKICTISIVIETVVLGKILSFFPEFIVKLAKNQIILRELNGEDYMKICFALMFCSLATFIIHKIPDVLIQGLTWHFMFVWYSVTVKIAVYLSYIITWITFIYVFLGTVFYM